MDANSSEVMTRKHWHIDKKTKGHMISKEVKAHEQSNKPFVAAEKQQNQEASGCISTPT